MPNLRIEVCIEGVDDLITAQDNGADRVELCASLLEGGLTPSYGVVREALRVARVPVYVMVRPRGGDFLYTEREFASMCEDVTALREMGVPGVVFGCLTPDGQVDEERTRTLVDLAGVMDVTFHRAFDMTRDPAQALEALIRCGVKRVLTSGQRDTAVEGMGNLRALQAMAGERIIVMGCGALRPDNINLVRQQTRLNELHFAAMSNERSGMEFRNPHVGMGGTERAREYTRTVTSAELVRRTVQAARGGSRT